MKTTKENKGIESNRPGNHCTELRRMGYFHEIMLQLVINHAAATAGGR